MWVCMFCEGSFKDLRVVETETKGNQQIRHEATSTLYEENVHFGTHLEALSSDTELLGLGACTFANVFQVWGSWYDTEKKCWGWGLTAGSHSETGRFVARVKMPKLQHGVALKCMNCKRRNTTRIKE